jgi:hypothetical protein
MIRNSITNDIHNTEIIMHREVWIIVVILCQFRVISVIKGFGVQQRGSPAGSRPQTPFQS